jgi:Domain of unknown function (DUF5069)
VILSSLTDDEVLAWVQEHAKPTTALEKHTWAEQIDRYRPDAALVEYRKRIYRNSQRESMSVRSAS